MNYAFRARNDTSVYHHRYYRKTGNYTVICYYYPEWVTPGQSYNTDPWSWFSSFPERIPLNGVTVEESFKWNLYRYYSDWSVGNATKSKDSLTESLKLTSTGADPILYSPDSLSMTGSDFPTIQIKVKRSAGSGWDGKVYFITDADQTYNETKRVLMSEPSWDGEWQTVNVTMSGNSTWNAGTIKRLRIDFGNSSSDVFYVQEVNVIGANIKTKGLPGDNKYLVNLEIEQAWNAGIDVFAIDNYCVPSTGVDFAKQTTDMLFESNHPMMEYCLMWANHSETYAVDSLTEWHTLLDSWNDYFKRDKYYKKSGKPVIMIFQLGSLRDWAHTFMGGSDARESLKLLLDDAQSYIDGGVYFVSCYQPDHPYFTGVYQTWTGTAEYAGCSAYTAYNIHNAKINISRNTTDGGTFDYKYSSDGGTTSDTTLVNTFTELRDCHMTTANTCINSAAGIPYWVNVTSGWSRYPWENYNATLTAHDDCIPTRQDWVDHLTEVKTLIDANTTETDRTITIYAWNEYGEGGWLSPSSGRSDWADQIKSIFGNRDSTLIIPGRVADPRTARA